VPSSTKLVCNTLVLRSTCGHYNVGIKKPYSSKRQKMGSRFTQLLILNALYRTTRCGASLAVRCGGSRRTACSEYSDRRADLTLLIVGMLAVLDRKVLAPIGSE